MRRIGLILVVMLAVVLGGVMPALAQQAPSPGCQALAGLNGGNLSAVFSAFGFSFNAGEQLTVQFIRRANPNNPMPTSVEIRINGGTVSVSPIPPGIVSYTFPTTGLYNSVQIATQVAAGYQITCAIPPTPPTPKVVFPSMGDGRINDGDLAAPVAVFPVSIDGKIGLHCYSPQGDLLLNVSPAALEAAPANPAAPLLVAEGGGVSFYRLPDGRWQVNAPTSNGKTYTLIFSEPAAGTPYTSAES